MAYRVIAESVIDHPGSMRDIGSLQFFQLETRYLGLVKFRDQRPGRSALIHDPFSRLPAFLQLLDTVHDPTRAALVFYHLKTCALIRTSEACHRDCCRAAVRGYVDS